MRFANKSVLVTGSKKRTGFTIARSLPGDISNSDQVEGMFETIKSTSGWGSPFGK